jgi:ADP-ribosylglycohydrolase
MSFLDKLKQSLGLVKKPETVDPKIVDDLRDRFKGCMWLGAAGDAFGYVVEFKNTQEIQKRFRGPLEFKNLPHWATDGKFVVSDDTQMTMFTAEACDTAVRSQPADPDPTYSLPHVVNSNAQIAYLDWYQTQKAEAAPTNRHDRLISFKEMHLAQAPGNTCLASLKVGGRGGWQKSERINNSMGCGGVMRVAPLAFLPQITDREAFALGCRTAAQTHGHDMGIYPAGAFVLILKYITAGHSIGDAARVAFDFLSAMEPAAPLRDKLFEALAFEGRGPVSPAEIEALGGGWVGHECLAIGLASALLRIAMPDRMRVAANHSGDSDSTASVAGQLMGASFGYTGLIKRFPEFPQIEARMDVKRPLEFIINRFQENVIV